MAMKDYAHPIIGNTTSCIVLGNASRNYELKKIHFNMLPSFYGDDYEQVNLMESYQPRQPRNNPYSSTYNPGWRNHPNFSWRNNDHNLPQILRNQNQPQYQNQEPQYPRNQNPTFSNQGQAPQRKPSLEETLQSFMMATHDRMERNEKKTDFIEASVKRLEIQIRQIAEAVQENKKEKLTSQPEQAKAITILKDGELSDNNVKNLIEKDSSYADTSKKGGLVDVEITEGGLQKEGRIEHNLGQKEKDNEAFLRPKFHKAVEPYKPPIPFPNRLKETYAKFFKELNSNKRRYGNNEKVMVSETASAVLQQ
eukprot:XP_015581861.1 uncharacterized protein LOC107262176 [Ricinus communis]